MKQELKFKTNFDKAVIVDNLQKLHFKKTFDDDWSFYWSSVGNIKKLFNPQFGMRLRDHQIVNHFPNHDELTRKDLMVKNFKKYAKKCEKMGTPTRLLEYVPETFTLPIEFPLFEKKFNEEKVHGNQMWILKPIARYGGVGISIISKKSQIPDWMKDRSKNVSRRDQHVISKYISDPFLIGKRKFDLRLYVLVTSYSPLKAYDYELGFARFSAYKYTNDSKLMDDMSIHLTNVTLQKCAPAYNESHGMKWRYRNLLTYLEHTRGREAVTKLKQEIEYIYIHSLKAVSSAIYNDKHCFELYGYDIMIDNNLKPWLIEVNASPSLSCTTAADRVLKVRLMNDTFKIVIRKEYPDIPYTEYKYTASDDDIGKFNVLISESLPEPKRTRDRPFMK